MPLGEYDHHITGFETASLMPATLRNDLSRICLISGPLTILMGWGAAFTTIGAQMIYLGIALPVVSAILWPRRKRILWAVVLLFLGLFPPWFWIWQPIVPILFWTMLVVIIRWTRPRDAKLTTYTD
jgi:hypothetical protein